MRTVSFKSVLWRVARKIGLDPATELLADQADALTDYINERLREAWESYDWPEWMLVENRAYRAEYNNATAYALGAEVYYATTGKYYSALGSTTGHLPTDAAYWEEDTDLERYVAWEQTGQTKLGEVMGIYERDPRASLAPGELSFSLVSEGVLLRPDAPATVWILFRRRPPTFTATAWAAGVYAPGDLVYYSTTGECYECTAATTTEAPTDTGHWEKLNFPYVLSSAVAHGAYADALREDGQGDKAAAEEGRAEALLIREYDKLELQQQRRRRFRVRT